VSGWMMLSDSDSLPAEVWTQSW